MVSSVNNVHLGPVLITYKGTDAGWTDEAGVSVALPGHDYQPITVDQYAKMAIGAFDLGMDTQKVLIKFNLMENTHENRDLFSPLSTLFADSTITEGQLPFTEMSSSYGVLNLHPRSIVSAANESLDIEFHLALMELKGDFQQGVENVQVLPVEGSIIADTSKTATNLLFKWGGPTS